MLCQIVITVGRESREVLGGSKIRSMRDGDQGRSSRGFLKGPWESRGSKIRD